MRYRKRVKFILLVLAIWVVGTAGAQQGGTSHRDTDDTDGITLTHSGDPTRMTAGAAACKNGEHHNIFWRVFDLTEFSEVSQPFVVNAVEFAALPVNLGRDERLTLPVQVELYTLDGAFISHNLTQIAAATVQIEDLTGARMVSVPIKAQVAPDAVMVVGISATRSTGKFRVAGNFGGETAPTYVTLPCIAGQPIDYDLLEVKDAAQFGLLVHVKGKLRTFSVHAPEDNAGITDPQGGHLAAWDAVAAAQSYTFTLDTPSEEPTPYADLTPAADDDELTCDRQRCRFELDDLLTEDGKYRWWVEAVTAEGVVSADNTPYKFTVASPAVAFDLTRPESGTVLTAPPVSLEWEASGGASSYAVTLERVSTVRDVVMTAVVPAEACCTLSLDPSTQSLVTSGIYTWTVQALNALGEATVAANAPFTFTVSGNGVELAVNGAFELSGDRKAIPAAPWQVKNGAKLRCGKGSASGQCALLLRGAAMVRQKLDSALLLPGTGVTFSAAIKSTKDAPAAVILIVKYADDMDGDGTPDRLRLPLTASPGDGFTVYTANGTISTSSAVTGARIELRHRGDDKVWVDNVSVKLIPPSGAAAPLPTVVPLPTVFGGTNPDETVEPTEVPTEEAAPVDSVPDSAPTSEVMP